MDSSRPVLGPCCTAELHIAIVPGLFKASIGLLMKCQVFMSGAFSLENYLIHKYALKCPTTFSFFFFAVFYEIKLENVRFVALSDKDVSSSFCFFKGKGMWNWED